MTNKKPQKTPKVYTCDECAFISSNKKDYMRHLSTAKHKMVINGNKKNPKKNTHVCSHCDKVFMYLSGLSRHLNTCILLKNTINHRYNTITGKPDDTNIQASNLFSVVDVLKQNQEFKELMIEQSRQLQLQQEENKELHKQLVHVVKYSNNHIQNQTINNTTHNKFNLNFFLNTTCKDAMNMSDFIEDINVNFKDIENIGKNGYISGMTDIILSRIRDLDITKRPLHCTDLKRETMYIKDNDEWSKDSPENTKLRNMITIVAKQNCNTVPLWRKEHPECNNYEHPKYNLCFDIMRNTIGSVGLEQNKLDNKVIKNLSKHIFVK